jgi:putative peptidoglycan lipid II flippase
VAYSVAYSVGAVAALAALRKRIGPIGGRRLVDPVLRMAAASVAMGIVVLVASRSVGGDTGAGAGVRVGVGVLVGMAVYAGLLVALRVEDARRITTARRR